MKHRTLHLFAMDLAAMQVTLAGIFNVESRDVEKFSP
jgi:hypothetical protein